VIDWSPKSCKKVVRNDDTGHIRLKEMLLKKEVHFSLHLRLVIIEKKHLKIILK